MESVNLLATLLLPSIIAGLVSLVVNQRLKERELVAHARWQIKHQACLDALKIVDAHFSNIEWKDIATGKILDVLKQPEPPIELARECDNKLALSCETEEVVTWYRRCLGHFGDVNGDMIVDLRNAIRRELGFGTVQIDQDRDRAFIGRLSKKTS